MKSILFSKKVGLWKTSGCLNCMHGTLMIPFLDRLSSTVLNQLLNVLCNLMNPNKADATRGRHSLAGLMENLAYASLTGTQCPNPTPPEM